MISYCVIYWLYNGYIIDFIFVFAVFIVEPLAYCILRVCCTADGRSGIPWHYYRDFFGCDEGMWWNKEWDESKRSGSFKI